MPGPITCLEPDLEAYLALPEVDACRFLRPSTNEILSYKQVHSLNLDPTVYNALMRAAAQLSCKFQLGDLIRFNDTLFLCVETPFYDEEGEFVLSVLGPSSDDDDVLAARIDIVLDSQTSSYRPPFVDHSFRSELMKRAEAAEHTEKGKNPEAWTETLQNIYIRAAMNLRLPRYQLAPLGDPLHWTEITDAVPSPAPPRNVTFMPDERNANCSLLPETVADYLRHSTPEIYLPQTQLRFTPDDSYDPNICYSKLIAWVRNGMLFDRLQNPESCVLREVLYLEVPTSAFSFGTYDRIRGSRADLQFKTTEQAMRGLRKTLLESMASSKQRNILLQVSAGDSSGRHVQILLIDRCSSSILRINTNQGKDDANIDTPLEDFFKGVLSAFQYEVLNHPGITSGFRPCYRPQGICMAWSTYLVAAIALNPDADASALISLLKSIKSSQRQMLVEKWMQFLCLAPWDIPIQRVPMRTMLEEGRKRPRN